MKKQPIDNKVNLEGYSTMTYRQAIEDHRLFVRAEMKELDGHQAGKFNRKRYNRMNAEQQNEYDKKMNEVKKYYFLYLKDGTSYCLPKYVYTYFLEWFNTQPKEVLEGEYLTIEVYDDRLELFMDSFQRQAFEETDEWELRGEEKGWLDQMALLFGDIGSNSTYMLDTEPLIALFGGHGIWDNGYNDEGFGEGNFFYYPDYQIKNEVVEMMMGATVKYIKAE